MMRFFFHVFCTPLLIAGLFLPALACGASDSSLIEVSRELGIELLEKCRLAKVEIVMEDREARIDEFCMPEELVPSIPVLWEVDVSKREVIETFPIHTMWVNSHSTVVVSASTWTHPFGLSDYLAIQIGRGFESDGSPICMLSATGFVPIEIFGSKYHLINDNNASEYVKARNLIELHIKNQQPWCG